MRSIRHHPAWRRFTRPVALLGGVAVLTSTFASPLPGGWDLSFAAASVAAGSPQSARQVALAADAYVWGMPLVVSMRTVETFARVIGVDHLANQQQLSDPQTRVIVAPNVDTLYSVAVLDLRRGPLVLTVPRIDDRYYTYEFLDMYTEAFAYVGTRATGGESGSWLIVAPGWTGTTPAGDHLIRASTSVIFLLGRFLVSTPADLAPVRAMMAAVQLAPLTPTTTTPQTVPPLPLPAGSPQAAPVTGAAFFGELDEDLVICPPTNPADRAALARFAGIDVGSGLDPKLTDTPAQLATLARGEQVGEARVTLAEGSSINEVNGWQSQRQTGHYGTNFLLRAEVARAGWGANIPQEAVYLRSQSDSRGAPLTGIRRYTLRFPAGGLPPAKAFWSVTLYGPDGFLVANAEHRYAIGDRTPGLRRTPDGSLVLYLQHAAPPGHLMNWLPTPVGRFTLILRIYLPKPVVLDGDYRPAPVEPVG